ncbi:helix-turn-helix transcriptional regulator [Neobacillus cucumis]|nr:helix-turn-helix transcriptional regulator [Neobacillus cucumis]
MRPNETFGELLARLRRIKLLSSDELAYLCGKSRKNISELENDKAGPPMI